VATAPLTASVSASVLCYIFMSFLSIQVVSILSLLFFKSLSSSYSIWFSFSLHLPVSLLRPLLALCLCVLVYSVLLHF
jgi:hypothetical protein